MSHDQTNPNSGGSGLPIHFQGLRVSAQPFVPNVNAVPFQPGGGGGGYPDGQMYGHYQMGGMYGQPPHMMYPHQPHPHHQSGYMAGGSGYHPRTTGRQPLQVANDLPYYNDGNGKFRSPPSTGKQPQGNSITSQTSNTAKVTTSPPTAPAEEEEEKEVDSWEQIADETTPPKHTNKDTEPIGTKGAVTSEDTTADRHTPSDSYHSSPNIDRITTNTKPEATTTTHTTTTTTTAPKPTSSGGGVKMVVAPPKDKSEKENVNIIFIGHVDAGKSTIGGHIMYLTGGVDKRTLEKYEREAREKNRETWYLSWALDTNQEERDKGKTVEVGRAFFETERKRFTILDAPGHAGFVPNMIGGAVQADIGVLVISARRGEFETGFEKGGQTREHAMLAKTAGVKHLVVLINKMDDPTVQWSLERYDECKTKLTPFLKKLGFNPKTDLFFMPVSGLTGANLKEPLTDKWYKGPAFIPYLDQLPSIVREDEGPFRLPIADKFKDMGTVVMGKVESGSVCKGSQFIAMPNRTMVEVLSVIRVEEEVPAAYSGDNIKLKLKGIEEEDISPGFVLCSPHNLCHIGRVFDAQVVILEYKSIICAGFSCVLHIHNAVEEVEITHLIAKIDKKTGKKMPEHPKFIKQDNTAIARFQTSRVVCMETFKDFPAMARFTLRDEGKTIAIGKVLKIVD